MLPAAPSLRELKGPVKSQLTVSCHQWFNAVLQVLVVVITSASLSEGTAPDCTIRGGAVSSQHMCTAVSSQQQGCVLERSQQPNQVIFGEWLVNLIATDITFG
jgi:hypothetical protein